VVRALRDDPADLLVRAGGGQRWRALRALPALRALFSMTPQAPGFLKPGLESLITSHASLHTKLRRRGYITFKLIPLNL